MTPKEESALFEGNKLKIPGAKKPKAPTTNDIPEPDIEQPEDVTTIASKLVKANIDNTIVQVNPDKTYSNGKTGAEIAAENPVRKSSTKTKKKQKKSKTTSAKKEKQLTDEERQEAKRKYWREYQQRPGVKEKYRQWNFLWRQKQKKLKESQQKKSKSSKKTTTSKSK